MLMRSVRRGEQTRGAPDPAEETRGLGMEKRARRSARDEAGEIPGNSAKAGKFLYTRKRRNGAACRGGGKGSPVPGQPLTPSLGGELRTKQASLSAVPALQCVRLGGAALPEAEALAKSSAEGTSLRGVLRRGVEAPEFLIPAERAATRPTLSVFPAESRPKEKAACVSGGSADRP